MNFSQRLAAMKRLGEATMHVAERAHRRRIIADDMARSARLGDVEGQTRRAQEFADRLDRETLTGWPN